ncbi:MAG TPA: hypothetical protein VFI23_13355 [Rhizomicrobium sp.]|nr:hypothetical protein [Rhizomicrobium sp.]
MRVATGLLAAAGMLFLGLPMAPAAAASFDGKWLADIPASDRCNFTSTMILLVAGGDIQGQVRRPNNNVGVTGKVDADGNGSILVANVSQGTIKFSGDHFDADWSNNSCSRHASGNRDMDATQQAAVAAERKQHQDSYAELVRRANAGEKIDYTALRAEYVYSEGWDFYDNKLGSLLDQANLAAKGKDCATALDKTEQVVKIDFLIDSAHAIRADCLADSERAKSRVEQNIADGLIHSLMDSGDGDNMNSAYIVSTLREEMDVLANRHIQIKARQTEVRGSNGRFYDVVQGISIRNGGISAKTVYFDVGSFEKGRESKRAALAVAAAGIH